MYHNQLYRTYNPHEITMMFHKRLADIGLKDFSEDEFTLILDSRGSSLFGGGGIAPVLFLSTSTLGNFVSYIFTYLFLYSISFLIFSYLYLFC